jgi:hypothetical protein
MDVLLSWSENSYNGVSIFAVTVELARTKRLLSKYSGFLGVVPVMFDGRDLVAMNSAMQLMMWLYVIYSMSQQQRLMKMVFASVQKRLPVDSHPSDSKT